MFAQINRALLRRLERNSADAAVAAVELSPDGFVLARPAVAGAPRAAARHAWSDVQGAVALLMPGLVGGDECLLVEAAGATFALPASAQGFDAFVAIAPARLHGWREACEWRLALAATPVGEPVGVYRRITHGGKS